MILIERFGFTGAFFIGGMNSADFKNKKRARIEIQPRFKSNIL
jgi:hypothetical protein